MKNEKLLRSIGLISDDLIQEYPEYLQKQKKMKKHHFYRIISIAACVMLICTALPLCITQLINHNAPDTEYEATHKVFNSIQEAKEVLGEEYLFPVLTDVIRTEITLGFQKGGSVDDKSTWTSVDCLFTNTDEKIVMTIFLPAYSGEALFPEMVYESEKQIGSTSVSYTEYGDNNSYSDYDYAVIAKFKYAENLYVFEYHSNSLSNKAFQILEVMLTTQEDVE